MNKKCQNQHIYFCADHNYLPFTSATMASILANSSANTKQTFHIISDDITDNDIIKLQNMNDIKKCDVILHKIHKEEFEQCNDMDFGYLSLGSLYRFKIADFFPKDADKVLYLDGDMIVTSPLDDLFATDLENNFAAVVEEKGAIQVQNLQLQSGKYFNAGMILFNTKKFIGHDLLKEALEYYSQNKEKILFHDQDILNGLWDTQTKFIEQKYNVPSFVKHFKNPVIIHYTGFVKKPWHTYCRHPLKNEWLKYAQMSPYKKSANELLIFKIKRFLSNLFYFSKDPTHKKYYILCLFGMNFGIGKKDNKSI
ncbi:MAG: glycosyltransferase family 8 protein [Alphaproteobacteria bacterium]|nr:glycosyltransferase family 8 protein [Alphaproteobacteria bacterium]